MFVVADIPVLAMAMAQADGCFIRVGSRSIKQSSGYDLVHLFIASEGMSGVIIEATPKSMPVATVMGSVKAPSLRGMRWSKLWWRCAGAVWTSPL